MNKLKDDAAVVAGRVFKAGAKLGLVGLPLVIASTAIPGLTGVIIGLLAAGTVVETMRSKDHNQN